LPFSSTTEVWHGTSTDRVLGDHPIGRSLLLFANRRRDRIKALGRAGDGLVFWYKQTAQGTFVIATALPWAITRLVSRRI